MIIHPEHDQLSSGSFFGLSEASGKSENASGSGKGKY